MIFPSNQSDDLDGAYSLPKFCEKYSVGPTFTYQLIKDKKLRAVKAEGKTLILRRDAQTWANSLPAMNTRAA